MNDTNASREWLTASQAMAYLQVSRPTLYRRIGDGSLRRFHMGRTIRFRREDVEALIQPEPDRPVR
jgi:excisionase family DNA binding protein